jgi:hypothetical protein
VSVEEALRSLPCLLQTTATGLNNSVAKKAETLFLNLECLIERRGIEKIGFFTLTFAENIKSRKEAQRRFHSFATGFLSKEVDEYIATVERQLRGAIHYHCIVAFPYDIRSGFDFDSARTAGSCRKVGDVVGQKSAEVRYYRSANAQLSAWWVTVRKAAKKYGFGRCETLPVLSNSAALSRYVGGYVGSEWSNRKPIDKGLRTIRYGLDHRSASVLWAWVSGPGEDWRRGVRVLGAILQVPQGEWRRGWSDEGQGEVWEEEGGFTPLLGKQWAHNWHREVLLFGRHWKKCLAFTERTLSDESNFVERVQFAAQMAEVIAEHDSISAANKPNPVLTDGAQAD